MSALAFDLQVPMVSWAITGSSIVPSGPVPTWSAVVGMIGAALGVPRDDEALVHLANDYALAFKVISPGEVRSDYHTVQSPPANRAAVSRSRTRAQELGVVDRDDLNTTITRRDYVQGAHYRIFVVQVAKVPHVSLDELVIALNAPIFPIYAGRRSCLVGRVNAVRVDAGQLLDATHWDQRIGLAKPCALVAERRDLLLGKRAFGVRFECIA
jgi:CRISPR system Cascade subunit CasD